MSARHLITTADERTWKFDQPVLFLGEWCRRYERRHVWEEMDAIVAPPYGSPAAQRAAELGYVYELADRLLEELTGILNDEHRVHRSQRYWKIVLGHWLQRYVAVALNRYRTVETALSAHAVLGTTVLRSSPRDLASVDSLSFIWSCNDDAWNHAFYTQVLEYLDCDQIYRDSQLLRPDPRDFAKSGQPRPPRALLQGIKPFVFDRVLPALARETDAVIVRTYLPLVEEVKLQLRLGQVPQYWQAPSHAAAPFNLEWRQRLKLSYDHLQGFERFVRKQLPHVIPGCYLEGYRGVNGQATSLRWPMRPKFIFTSNRFDTDEVFKVWAAEKADQGIPYFTGQHGNNYGTLLGNANWPERATCDRFFTWGWQEADGRSVPAFIFKTVNRQPRRSSPAGGLLLIEVCAPHRLTAWDTTDEFGRYLGQQFEFVESLPAAIRSHLTVRLHSEFKRHHWAEQRRWNDRIDDVRVEAGATHIRQLISDSRLVVHSYDSTGILETLALNTPTLCFWDGGFDHLVADAKPYYQLLKDAGILHGSPRTAAEMVTKHWDSIGEWWAGQEVQRARTLFCERYARTDDRPILTLKELLLSHAAKISGGTK